MERLKRIGKCMQRPVMYGLLAVTLLVAGGSEVFAVASTACTDLGTATMAAPPTFSVMVSCIVDTLKIYATIGVLLAIIIPLMLIVWGAKGGFATIGSLFTRLTSSLKK